MENKGIFAVIALTSRIQVLPFLSPQYRVVLGPQLGEAEARVRQPAQYLPGADQGHRHISSRDRPASLQ